MTNLGIEAGQTWEGRNRRRDGSREQLHVLEVNGLRAICTVMNPLPGKPAQRSVGILATQGSPLLGNLRLVRTADGRVVKFGPGGELVGVGCDY